MYENCKKEIINIIKEANIKDEIDLNNLQAIVDKIHNMDKQKYKSVVFEDFDEQYMYFFAIALFFLLIEFLIGENRGRNLFKSVRRK